MADDADLYARARSRIAASPNGTEDTALAELLHHTDPLLTETPPSVTTKSQLPPSRDPHDYCSLGTYWWPNPDTGDGLPYVRRDGHVNPLGRTNAFDRIAIDHFATGVRQLMQAALLTGDSHYHSTAAKWWRAWFIDAATRMNPHLRFSQRIPGICDGRDIGIIDTMALVRPLRLLMQYPPAGWTTDDTTSLRKWFSEYLDWLLTSANGVSERAQHNNHGTWYDAQCVWFAIYCERFTIAREIVRDAIVKRVAHHVAADGSQPHELGRTRPVGYSCMNLIGFFELADAGNIVGIDLYHTATADGRSIRRACEWIVTNFVDGQPDTKLDSLDAIPEKVAPLLRRAATAFNDNSFDEAIQRLPQNKLPRDVRLGIV